MRCAGLCGWRAVRPLTSLGRAPALTCEYLLDGLSMRMVDSVKIISGGSSGGRMPPAGASGGQPPPAPDSAGAGQGLYGYYRDILVVHGITETSWWSMVRRRSTVRFRKGAPRSAPVCGLPQDRRSRVWGQIGGQDRSRALCEPGRCWTVCPPNLLDGPASRRDLRISEGCWHCK
jgi:hypothetical protein